MKLTTKQLERWVEDCKHLPQNEPAAMAKELLLLRARDGAAKEVIKAAKAWKKHAEIIGTIEGTGCFVPLEIGERLLKAVKSLSSKKKGSRK